MIISSKNGGGGNENFWGKSVKKNSKIEVSIFQNRGFTIIEVIYVCSKSISKPRIILKFSILKSRFYWSFVLGSQFRPAWPGCPVERLDWHDFVLHTYVVCSIYYLGGVLARIVWRAFDQCLNEAIRWQPLDVFLEKTYQYYDFNTGTEIVKQ